MHAQKLITDRIDSMIGYLNLVKEGVENNTPENNDSLDILSFVSVLLTSTYNDISETYHIKED